jgi:hypothetical protein
MESMQQIPPTPGDPGAASDAAILAAHQKVASPVPELAEAIAKGYEPHDIRLRGTFIFMGSLVVTVLLVLLIVWGIMGAMVAHDREQDPVASPVAIDRPDVPEPLQPSIQHDTLDRQDMEAMREETQKVLTSSGTTSTGRRYIDIKDAITRVLPLLPIRPSVSTGHAEISSAESAQARAASVQP